MAVADTSMDTGIAARIAALPEAVDGDPALVRRGRFLNATWQLDIGDDAFLVRIADGKITHVRHGPFVTPSADFAMIAAPDIWKRLLVQPPAPPGDQDFLAFVKRREMKLAGNLQPLMSHLLYFKGLLAHLREAHLREEVRS